MNDPVNRDLWLGSAAGIGLTPLGESAPEGVPTVDQALLSVTNMEVRPTRTVPVDSPDAWGEVDRQWLSLARDNALFTEDGRFLIVLPGPGAVESGWVPVQWVDGVEISSRLSHRKENVDFLAMSLDGKVLCAVTEEDSDYWIILHEFSCPGCPSLPR
ncbi:hypothetical protein ACIBCM_24295 [Streptomyces sp. NPDC051018]|uniref:hypothetical protein n=1 Tax=Streptomyces sp. NPDC051018 TaxID=3365639 RepID=UPI003788EBCD